ncbi:MAG: RNA polymerase factor sigma-54 [Gammaproteobacteria bacterium]|jgi:RNA polymerase sigma-54 factor|nr:RNA polymerase factor sigma-54 [Gammaproteobacteria bacterium]NBP07807.1 RNA polymerase factor sigma-54 [Gammaproteobacteria bacterium]NCW20806.1 RNA polymerase factor sigma-54 [Gammaproteobacteria bacterium]NDA42130.1 RNA polymerase factor sigma-54 [Gammaproteobacteria bacterium]NDE86065.1 RNA polymerase factor sigma-54 [Gammaproteobacteria bacterium]
MLKQSLQLKLGQSLTMTPQLQQAIRLLQMPTIELQAHLAEVLESNVMLEQEDPEDEVELGSHFTAVEQPAAVETPEPVEVEVVEQPWADRPGTGSDAGRAEDDEMADRDIVDERGQSLRDHLLGQLELAGLSDDDLTVATALVDALNDDGYLTETLSEIGASLQPDLVWDDEEIERVLLLVQTLEPVGIGARSLAECLTLQLAQLDAATPGLALALLITAQHLDLLAKRDPTPLAEATGAAAEDLAAAIALVRACHPRPGSLVSAARPEYVIPDVFVRRTAKGWAVELNPGTAPRIRVNQEYVGMLGRGSDHTTLRTQLQEARWLLKSLEIRNDTLLKVTRAIVARQADFLNHGDERMKPMILKDIAAAIEMHESTISRVTSGKYMHTPRGVYELRYFFSSQVEGGDGQGTSSTAIRAKIRKLIRDEDATNPLSDSRLAEILSGEGIPVARRTVAKYREGLGIDSSAERKKVKSR